jgi:hypothetical protein
MAPGMPANRELQLVHPEVQMRSDLVFGAMGNVSNRYLLTKLASKAIRGMHKPGVQIEDTINDVLVRFSCDNPIACKQALREPLTVPLCAKMTRPVLPHKSKVVALPPAREKADPLWEATRALGA